MSTSYIIGFVCGLICVVLVYAIKRKVLHSKARCEELDERQKIINGQAYKVGFFSLMAANFVYAFVESNLNTVHINNFVGVFACCCVGIIAYAGYSIFHDSYYGIKNQSNRYHIFFTLMGIVSGLSAVIQIARGNLVENGEIGEINDYRSDSFDDQYIYAFGYGQIGFNPASFIACYGLLISPEDSITQISEMHQNK